MELIHEVKMFFLFQQNFCFNSLSPEQIEEDFGCLTLKEKETLGSVKEKNEYKFEFSIGLI